VDVLGRALTMLERQHGRQTVLIMEAKKTVDGPHQWTGRKSSPTEEDGSEKKHLETPHKVMVISCRQPSTSKTMVNQ